MVNARLIAVTVEKRWGREERREERGAGRGVAILISSARGRLAFKCYDDMSTKIETSDADPPSPAKPACAASGWPLTAAQVPPGSSPAGTSAPPAVRS